MYAAVNPTSRPYVCGSIEPPSTAPINVPKFHNENNAIAVVQNAIFCNRGFVCAVIIAVVSSITKCAARRRLPNDSPKYGDSARPYTPFRAANSKPLPNAAETVPPVETMDIADICDAPVNAKKLNAHVCHTLAPAPTASTPKASANTPTAPLNASAEVTTGRTSGSIRNFMNA